MTTETASAPISTWRNASASGLDQQREQRDGGDQEDGDLGARRERDLRRELDLAARGDDDRTAVLGRVADDRDHDRGEEELAHAGVSSANVLIEPTRISATSAVTTVASPSTTSASRSDQPLISSSLAMCSAAWRRSEYHVNAT